MARILLVDDDADVRNVVRRLLERAGHTVDEAADGRIGVERFRAEPADVVIMDIFMPNQEGLETIRELRREFGDVKIIAMSGGGRTGDLDFLEHARAFGAARSLLKPVTADVLLAAIDELTAESGEG